MGWSGHCHWNQELPSPPRRWMNTRRNVLSSSEASFARRSKDYPAKVTETYRRCCGIDVYRKSITVCVLAPAGQKRIEIKRRKFRIYTRDLKQMRAWLRTAR